MEPETIRPVRNEADHQDALERLNRIFQAEPGTPLGDERDLLVALIELYEIKHHPMPGGPTAAESMQMALESTLWRLHKGLMEHARGLEHDQGVEPRTTGHDEAEPEYGGAAAVQGSRQHLMLTGLDDDGKRLLAHVEIVEIAREDDLRNALASAQRLEGATGIRAKAVVVCISAQQGLPELPVHIHAMKDHSTADASVRSGETGRPGRPGSGPSS